MVKSIGKNKISCAVFISGNGSNLKSIYNYSKKKSSKIDIKLVISSRANVGGIKFAQKKNINNKVIKFNNKNYVLNNQKNIYSLRPDVVSQLVIVHLTDVVPFIGELRKMSGKLVWSGYGGEADRLNGS